MVRNNLHECERKERADDEIVGAAHMLVPFD